MDNKIGYRNFDDSFFKDEYEWSLGREARMIQMVQRKGDKFHTFYKNAIKWAGLKIVNGETDIKELTKYFRYGMQGMYGHVYSLLHLGQPVELFIGNQKVTVTNESKEYSHLYYLLEIINFAQICRCKVLLDLVLNIPRTSVFFSHPYQEHIIKIFELEVEWYLRSEFDLEKFQSCYDEYRKKPADAESLVHRKNIFEPMRSVEKALYWGSEIEFNQKLKGALDLNRSYYDSPEDNRYKSIDDMLPWTLIGLACQAFDKGWNITVEDSRLPMFLVRGECPVESLEIPA